MLPKKNRLQKKSDFNKAYEKGYYCSAGSIGAKVMKNGLRFSRIGFSVGKNISKKATERNKIRRTLREAVKKNLSAIKSGLDIVIIYKKNAQNDKKYISLPNQCQKIEKLFKKINLL